jgi:hypothetical protein
LKKELVTEDVIDNLARDPFPSISEQVDNQVVLQRGLYNEETNEWDVIAEVRELTGYDEERLATVEGRKNITYAEYMTEVLKLGVVSIGNSNFKDRLDDLALGDRDSLFLGIVRTTYGRERNFLQTCPECSKANDITLDLYDDFPIQEPGFDPTSLIEMTLNNGQVVGLSIPTARDSLYVAKHGKNGAEQNTLMLSRCVAFQEGEAPRDPVVWAKSLSLRDRNLLIKRLLDIKMGPKVGEVDANCVHCGAKMPVMIDWIFLIFG